VQISRSKLDSLHRTPAGFTVLAFDGNGLRECLPARPTSAASYPISVRRVATLLHASFRRSLAVPPLRFASASPPSGCTGDFHPHNCRTCPTHRLALRAPALRAATALTRPSRSAQRLPCGRQNVPTAKTVGPNNVVANHCVESSAPARACVRATNLQDAASLLPCTGTTVSGRQHCDEKLALSGSLAVVGGIRFIGPPWPEYRPRSIRSAPY
jgi:hypothetical protein